MQKHANVGGKGNAGVENFRSEFAHAFCTGVRIGDCLGQKRAGIFPRELCAAFVNQICIEVLLHAAADIVCKMAHIKTLQEAGALYDGDGGKIAQNKTGHVGKAAPVPGKIHQTLRHLSLKPGTGQKAEIINQTGDGDDQKKPPLAAEIE